MPPSSPPPPSFKSAPSLARSQPCWARLIAALPYRGKRGQRYSLLNHFISELGEAGVSRRAWAFNGGLILCGMALLPCSVGLGLLIPGAWAKLGMVAGAVTAIGVTFVGIYPMNNLTPHVRAAMTYFRAGLVMVIFFTIAIFTQPADNPVLPRLVGLMGIPAILAYSFFLVYMSLTSRSGQSALSPLEGDRPRFWVMPFSEWLIFLTTVPWFCAVALAL